MKKNPKSAREILGRVLFISLALSVIYAFIRFLMAPESAPAGQEYTKVKSDYLLMVTQCVLGLAVMSLPSMLNKRWKLAIPHFIYVLYYLFLYCAVFLGEVFEFYYLVPHWDTILHFFSGAMLGALGFVLVDILNRDSHVRVQLSPLFVSLFAFSFALAAGAVWEIYEFACDGLLSLNMQKYALSDGAEKIGRAALQDTMKDIIFDALAALGVSVLGYLSSIRRREKQKSVGEKELANETDGPF